MKKIERTIIIMETSLEFIITFHPRAKHLKIKICDDEIKVTCPIGVSINYITQFILSKGQWILDNYKKNNVQESEVFFLKNEEIKIKIIRNQDKISTKFEFNELIIKINNQTEDEDVNKIFKNWYINEAIKVFETSLKYYSNIIGVNFNKVTLKEQKTRWGSCSSKGNLNFNWHLVMAPSKILDYVVVHELCHLVHLNHSKQFWDKVKLNFPDYESSEIWLKDNGKFLKTKCILFPGK